MNIVKSGKMYVRCKGSLGKSKNYCVLQRNFSNVQNFEKKINQRIGTWKEYFQTLVWH